MQSATVTVTRRNDRLEIRAPFHLKDSVKEIPGRQWDKPNKIWWVPATQAAAGAIRAKLGTDLNVDIETLRLMASHEAATSAISNKHRDDLPDFPGRTEGWMHQRQGYWFAHPCDAAGLFMDMGTGKSKTAIGLLEGWEIDVAIILAPVKAVRVWPREFHGGDVEGFDGHSERDWIVVNGRGVAGRSGRPLKNPSMKQRMEQADQAIVRAARAGAPVAIAVNYEAAWQQPIAGFLKDVRGRAEQAFGRPVKVALICDESHKIKSPKGKWSRFAAELGKRCDKRLLLTGTPNPHSEPDLYAQFRAADPGVFGTNYNRFLHHFFEMGGFEGREVQGFRNQDAENEFIEAMASMAFICDSDDVLDLPEEVDMPTLTCRLGDEAAKHYTSMVEDFWTRIEGEEDTGDEDVMAPSALTQLLRLAQITSGHLPVGDKDAGTHRIVTIDDAKAKLLADTLDDMPAGEPIVIFGRFHHDLAVIQQTVEATGRTYGEISGRKGVVDGLTEDAKMNPNVDVVGVQLQAGGVGVDLTRARYAIYYALDFNLGDFKQSRKRVHRPGQTRPVTFIYLACEGTVDETIASALRNRDAVMTALKNAAKHRHNTNQEAA